jgi:phage shock protein A
MHVAERGLFREERLFKALLREMAELQSELDTAEDPRRLGLRLEIQACEMLLGQLKRILASASEARPQMPEKIASALSPYSKPRA